MLIAISALAIISVSLFVTSVYASPITLDQLYTWLVSRLDNVNYGLKAIKAKIDWICGKIGSSDNDYDASSRTIFAYLGEILEDLKSATYGLAKIKACVDEVEPMLKSSVYGLNAIMARALVVTDHALFDTTGGDTGAKAGSDKTFDFHLVARAIGDSATIRVTFKDGDWIDLPLKAADDTISLSQAAGGTPAVDGELVVTVTSGNAAGWVSVRTEKGATGPYAGSFVVTTPWP